MANSKKKNKYDISRKGRPMDVTAAVFVIYMLTVYALWMHHKYFDITGTRAAAFREGAGFFFLVFIMAFFFESSMAGYYGKKLPLIRKDTPLFLSPLLWMGLLTLAHLAAFLMAPDKKSAWSGADGRRFGLYLVLMLFLMFSGLTRGVRLPVWILYVAALVALLAAAMAVLQHFGLDLFHLRRDIKEGQQEKFISLFGNLNTYASYLAMVIPFFWGLLIFAEEKSLWLTGGILVALLSMGILPAKSDNIYIGILAAGLFLFFLALRKGRILEWTGGAFFLSGGLLMMAILNKRFEGSKKHLNGAAKLLENAKWMALLFLAAGILLFLLLLLKNRKAGWYSALSERKWTVIFALLLAAALFLGILLLKRADSDLVKLNDKWGTFRGYVWRRGFSLFRDASPLQKIFGYGNETVRSLMHDRYYEEMTRITRQTYDNLHNELLQYLVTTGLFGLITYLGWFLTSLGYLVKKGGERLLTPEGRTPGTVTLSLGAAAAGYFAQGLVNLNQPITTPYLFFIMALGIGILRGKDQDETIHKNTEL